MPCLDKELNNNNIKTKILLCSLNSNKGIISQNPEELDIGLDHLSLSIQINFIGLHFRFSKVKGSHDNDKV